MARPSSMLGGLGFGWTFIGIPMVLADSGLQKESAVTASTHHTVRFFGSSIDDFHELVSFTGSPRKKTAPVLRSGGSSVRRVDNIRPHAGVRG